MNQYPIDSKEYVSNHDAPIAKLQAVANQIENAAENRADSGRIPKHTLDLWVSEIRNSIKDL